MPQAPLSIDQPHGITTIDAHYVHPGYAAIHLIEREGRAAVVDTGTYHSVPHLLHVLAERGIDQRDVEMVFITHVHLDHAGGAGRLLEELPNARAVCHPRAVPHLVDPARLVEASRVVYGSTRFDELYGAVLPIEASRITPTRDLEQLHLGQSQLQVLHTPGHALHHHVLHDIDAAAVFTGDTFGLSYRQLDSERGAFVLPTTTPTQFDPEQLLASVNRILALGPRALYLTHFGGVTDVVRLGASLKAQIGQCVDIARRHAGSADRKQAIRDELKRLWLELLRDHGTRIEPRAFDELLENDLELNAQGLVAWLDRQARATPG